MEIDAARKEDEKLFWQAFYNNVEFHVGKGNVESYQRISSLLESDIQSFTSVLHNDSNYLEESEYGNCKYLLQPMTKQQICLRSLSTLATDSPYYKLLQLSYYHELSHALTNVLSRHQVGDAIWVGLREYVNGNSYGEYLNEVANDYFTFLLGARYTHLLGTRSLDYILTHSSKEWGLPISYPPFFLADLCQPLLWTFCNLPTVSYDALMDQGQSPILSTVTKTDGDYPVNEFLYASRMDASLLVPSINEFLDDNQAYETIAKLIEEIRIGYAKKDSSLYSKVNQFRDICDNLFFRREISMHDFFADETLLEKYNEQYNQSWVRFYRSYPEYLDPPKTLKL